MKEFIMLSGIPGSGKSTYAKEVLEPEENTVVISSDEIRKELFGSEESQENNKLVFEIAKERCLKALEENKKTVLDATNLNKKLRDEFLEGIHGSDTICILIYFDIGLLHAVQNNSKRERKVPEEIIKKMYENQDIPYPELEKLFDGIYYVVPGRKKKRKIIAAK